MAKYYFDIWDSHGIEYDDMGLDFPDLDAARSEARRALAELMHESISRHGKAVVCIDIRDVTGKAVIEVIAAADDRDR